MSESLAVFLAALFVGALIAGTIVDALPVNGFIKVLLAILSFVLAFIIVPLGYRWMQKMN